MIKGRILKGIAGFYYVLTDKGIYTTRARGLFRNLNLKPVTGDYVIMEVTSENDREGRILEVLERRNLLIRPAVANIDNCLLVIACKDPDISFLFTDTLLVALDRLGFKPLIFINKCDLDKEAIAPLIQSTYLDAGYEVITGSAFDNDTLDTLRMKLRGKTTALSGASGAGKSTLINALGKDNLMEVGEISQRTRRGRQTTRHTELIYLEEDTFVLDTPGFSSLSIEGLKAEDLKDYFPEFRPFEDSCRFRDCSHIFESEEICAVRRALSDGLISKTRYLSYRRIYTDLKKEEYS